MAKKIEIKEDKEEQGSSGKFEKNLEEPEKILEENVKNELEESEKKSIIKKKEKEIEAVLNIYTSFNNTIAHVTDASGRTLTKVSGGMVTKHSRLKANPTIAMFIAKRISENMKEKGIKLLYVRIRAKTGSTGPGPGANAIIKSLSREGFKIVNILDTTRVPRGGPKKKGGRRGRRV
ncbi:MAG: 30S ribosomal protein S11 [Nanoarchaeota archaeon]